MSSHYADFMRQAETYCATHGHRFTEPRRQVLKILVKAKKPLGAYAIIDGMRAGTKPPTVYRALEFWQQQGFVHGISSLNIFTVCGADHRHQGSQFTVCDDCGDVQEVHLCDLPSPLKTKVDAAGFHLARWNAELHGTCQKCFVSL